MGRNLKMMYAIRIAAGLYILYVAYGLLREAISNPPQPWYFMAIGIAFVIFGVGFLITGGLGFKKIFEQDGKDNKQDAEDESK